MYAVVAKIEQYHYSDERKFAQSINLLNCENTEKTPSKMRKLLENQNLRILIKK